MAEQAQLFDLAEGRRRRDAGMARVTGHTDPLWVRLVDGAIAVLAAGGETFTVEDVRRMVDRDPPHPNAWGPRFAFARRAGLIVPVGVAQAHRPERRANRMLAWRGAV